MKSFRLLAGETSAQTDRKGISLFRGPDRLKPVQGFFARLLMRKAGGRLPEPVILMSYKKHMAGLYISRLLHRSMCQSKHFPRVEAELFAGFTASRLNCGF